MNSSTNNIEKIKKINLCVEALENSFDYWKIPLYQLSRKNICQENPSLELDCEEIYDVQNINTNIESLYEVLEKLKKLDLENSSLEEINSILNLTKSLNEK